MEGILTGIDRNHYRLAAPKQIESADVTLELKGDAWIPRDRVLYVQVLG
jgi:hypothetical protein